jgi:hypothetical protein
MEEQEAGPVLPNFLGIGCYRCGSTWLHHLLDSHPDVFVPRQRKEIDFFRDAHFHRGFRWYERLFPPDDEASGYRAIGEVSPGYIYSSVCLQRIREVPSIERFLVMLRNPVDRAYSHFRYVSRYKEGFGDLRGWIEHDSRMIEEGMYAKYLRPWLEAFGPDRILIVFLEHVRTDLDGVRRRIGEFLGVDAARFPPDAGARQVNESFMPRFPRLYRAGARLHTWLIRSDLDRFFRPIKKKAKRSMGRSNRPALPPLDPENRAVLEGIFREPNRELEELLGVDLSFWRSEAGETDNYRRQDGPTRRDAEHEPRA